MKVLFIVTSYWAIGEMEIAIQFAKGMTDSEDVLFLVPRKHENYVKSKGFNTVSLYFNLGSLNKIMLKNIQETFKPDYIVLADYLNYVFCERHYGLTLDDLDCFTGELGAFDLYNQIQNPRRMDTYGFKSKLTVIDEKIRFILHPCPLLDASIDNPGKNRFAVSLVDKLEVRTKEDMRKAKVQLGIPEDKKVILITSAQWQTTYRKYERAVRFVEKSEKSFADILKSLAKDCYVVVIGQESNNADGIHYLPSIPPDIFDQYINATDLFIGRNIISTSFAKLILRGIAGVVLINSVEGDETYKCKMFPVGWYDYIATIETGNLYFELFNQIEMLNAEECVKKIRELLCKPIDYEKLSTYHGQLSRLKKAQDIFLELQNK